MYSKIFFAALYAIFVMVSSGMAAPARAENLYCKIVTVNEVSVDGKPYRLTGRENIRKEAEGSEFTIDKATGLMLGKHVENGNDHWNTTVLDRGGAQMSYKAFSQNKRGYTFAQYVEVRLWHPGPRKPFVLLDNEILTGYCTL